MTRVESELPFFFGRDSELFGIYHPSTGSVGKAVLLCAPLGQDHIRSHRLYRQLASALASEGMPVLRFDYYGCGDSAGASDQVDWDRCLLDTVAAANELRARSGLDQIVAFGARLGASIALDAWLAARLFDVVAWDPVVDGASHIATLDALQEALRCDTRRFVYPRSRLESDGQWLGFAVSPALRRQIASLRGRWSVTPSLLLDSLGAAPSHDWHELALDEITVQSLQPSTPWDDLARLEAAILSHPLVQAVTTHLRERSYA
jgi:uncharacterized protein